jgi:hypothetical protein
MSIDDELLQMKRKIASLTKSRDITLGRKEQMERELMDRFGISNADKAEEEAEVSFARHKALSEEIAKSLENIKNKYSKLLEMAR